jgi:hypothetical protein
MGYTLEPLEEQLAGRDRQRLRAAMGTDTFETEYAAGRAPDPGTKPRPSAQPTPGQRSEELKWPKMRWA